MKPLSIWSNFPEVNHLIKRHAVISAILNFPVKKRFLEF